ncbi:uncharacterized protein TNCV_412881 [Trichonephila clavipes]|nr:uncharacterized protein TNCV_412881 [Trichonephila clavipes]
MIRESGWLYREMDCIRRSIDLAEQGCLKQWLLSPCNSIHWDSYLSGSFTRLEGQGYDLKNNSSLKADQAWLYYYDPTIKQQSSEWKHPSSPTPMKAKTVKSAGRVMTIIFLYYEGIVYQHAVEPGVLQQNNVEILPHPPYSPDLTPCDFWLFPQLKKPLRDKRFASNKA